MSDISIRAKSEIKITTPTMNLTHTYVKGASVKRLVQDMARYVLIDEGEEALRKIIDDVISPPTGEDDES